MENNEWLYLFVFIGLPPKAKDALAKADERNTSAMKDTITVSVFTAPSNHPI